MVHCYAAWTVVLTLSGLATVIFASPQEVFEGSKIAKLPPHALPSSLGLSGGISASCDVYCNDYKMHVDGSYAEKGGSCWGKFKSKCEIHGSRIAPNLTVTYKCDGAYTFTPLSHDDKVNADVSTCEGAMFTMSEIHDEKCPGGTCYTGVFCLSNSATVSAVTDGYSESAVYCNQFSAYGSAYKVADSGSHGRKGHWDNSSKDADVTQILQESLTEGTWKEPLANVDRSMEASAIQEVEDEAADTTSAVSRASAASLLHRNPLAAVDKDDYTWTCNGAKIHRWLSWWPCWGFLKFKGKFADQTGSTAVDFECHGLTFPMWMVCKGFSTLHGNAKGEVDGEAVTQEFMEVASGKKRFFERRNRHGYHMDLTFSKGPSSAHNRYTWPEMAPTDAAKEAVAAIMSSVAQEVEPTL